MPKVTQYTPNQVSTQFVSQPRANLKSVDLSPIAKGLSDVGKAADQVADRMNTTSAEEALVKFERDKNDVFFNPDNGYFNTQGRFAYDGAASTNDAVMKLKKTYGDTLSPAARAKFDKVADQHITRAQSDIAQHSSKGLQTWEVATIESQVENTLENASLYWNQADKLKIQRVLGEQSILESSKITGIGPEATAEKLQTFRSSFAASAITAATLKSSADGKSAFDQYGDMLEGPQKVKIQSAIETRQKSEKIQSDAQHATLTATRLVSDYDSRSDIIAEVNKITDPDLRKSTMSQAMYSFNQKKIADSEDQAVAFQSAQDHVYDDGSATTFQAQYPDEWEKLSVKQKRVIESGKPIVTNQVLLTNLLLDTDNLKNINPNDYNTQIAPGADFNRLVNAVKTAKGTGTKKEKQYAALGRDRTKRTKEAAFQLFGPSTDTAKSEWNSEKFKQYDAFYSLVSENVKYREDLKQSELTPEEFNMVLADLTSDVITQVPTFFGVGIESDTILGMTAVTKEATVKAKDAFAKIPAEDKRALANALHERGVLVTLETLLEAYNDSKVD